ELLQKLQTELDNTRAKTDDLARDVGVTAELARLADEIRRVADQELRDAEAALARARSDPKAADLNDQFTKAADSIDAARRRINDLLKQNEQAANDRMDKRKLEDLAQEQKDLSDKAKTAGPKDAAELAKKQKEIEDQLAKLREQSEAIKKAADAARGEEAKKLADEAKKIADDMQDLNRALKQADKNSLEDRLAELKKKQDELARKA